VCKEFQMNLIGNISRVYEKVLGPLPEEGLNRYLEGSIVMDLIKYEDNKVHIFYPSGEKKLIEIDFDRRFNRLNACDQYGQYPISYGDNYIIWSKDKKITHDIFKRINAMPLKYPREEKWLESL